MRFTLPRDLYHGKNALEALKTLTGKRAIVVTGCGSMKRFVFLQKVEDYLKEAGMDVRLFEGVEPDPSVETVMKGAKAMEEFQPDWIAVSYTHLDVYKRQVLCLYIRRNAGIYHRVPADGNSKYGLV